MRRRWHVPDGLLPLLVVVWIFGWIPITIAVGALTTPCDSGGHCGMNSNAPGLHPYAIFMIAWFGVVIIPAMLAGLCFLALALWANRPRRVWESVDEDMRKAHGE